jgi:hypothetical protein
MKYIITIVFGIFISGCVCNLNWKRYAPVPNGVIANLKLVEDDLVIQIIGKDHSGRSGFSSDVRGPYSIHTCLATHTEVVGYEINLIEIKTNAGSTLIFKNQDDPTRVVCTKNQHELFIGRHTFEQVFDIDEPFLKIRMDGKIIFETDSTPFSVEKQFKLEEGKERWLSFSDLMSV